MSSTPASVTFVNHGNFDANLYWVDYQGNRQLLGTVSANGSRQVSTFVGHTWVVTESVAIFGSNPHTEESCQFVYAVGAGGGVVDIY